MPIIGVFFSWALLGEQVTLRKIIGGAIVIFGVMLSVRKSKTEAAVEIVEEVAQQSDASGAAEAVSQK